MTISTQSSESNSSIASVSSSDPAISVRNLWKVFGPNPNSIIGTPKAHLSRPELLEQTRCVAAVNDVSFDVADGPLSKILESLTPAETGEKPCAKLRQPYAPLTQLARVPHL